MSDDRENAICSCICIYHISEKKYQLLLVDNTGYVLPPNRAIGLTYIATKKQKKYEQTNNKTKTFDGKQNSLVARKSPFCNCAADQRLSFR